MGILEGVHLPENLRYGNNWVPFLGPRECEKLGSGGNGKTIFTLLKPHIPNVLSTALKFPCLDPKNGFQVGFAPFHNSSC